MALIDFAPFARAHAALHKLWTEAVGKPGYCKADWSELCNAIDTLGFLAAARRVPTPEETVDRFAGVMHLLAKGPESDP